MTDEEERAKNTKRRRRWIEQNPGKDNEAARQRYQQNPEKKLERNRQWRLKNREQLREVGRQRYQEDIINKRLQAKRSQQKHKKRYLAGLKKWRTENKEKHREDNKQWRERNKEYVREKHRQWVQGNRIKVTTKSREYSRMKRKTDVGYRITYSLRARLNRLLAGKIKSGRTLELLGASVDEFKAYLESQFQTGMTWQNYGKTGWHIDHIIPCSSFDLTDPKQQEQCFHWINLQPLWWWQNLSKGKRIAA